MYESDVCYDNFLLCIVIPIHYSHLAFSVGADGKSLQCKKARSCNNLVISALYFGIWPCPAVFLSLDFVSAIIAFLTLLQRLDSVSGQTDFAYLQLVMINLVWVVWEKWYDEFLHKQIDLFSSWMAASGWTAHIHVCTICSTSAHNLLDYLLPNLHRRKLL